MEPSSPPEGPQGLVWAEGQQTAPLGRVSSSPGQGAWVVGRAESSAAPRLPCSREKAPCYSAPQGAPRCTPAQLGESLRAGAPPQGIGCSIWTCWHLKDRTAQSFWWDTVGIGGRGDRSPEASWPADKPLVVCGTEPGC